MVLTQRGDFCECTWFLSETGRGDREQSDCMYMCRVAYGSGPFAQMYQPHTTRTSFTHECGFKAKM